MAILTASKVARSFGALDVFEDISVSIPHGAKIAIVGPNGGGKTTLIRILIGLDTPSAGEVHRARGLTIGYLPQESEYAFHDSNRTVWDEMLSVFEELRVQERALRAMEERMEAPNAPTDLIEEYGTALERFEHAGGYAYELQIRQVLEGLGFSRQERQMLIGHLSGGQKTRALLARLLLRSPDLLVLDEPTNHLDIKAMEWLETRLTNWPGALLMVSHDRYFLDRVVNRVWELNWGSIESYRGNYSSYVEQRAERVVRRQTEYEEQQAFIAKEEDFIRRHLAGQRTKEAQGRRKRLERFKRDEMVSRPLQERKLRLQLRASRRSGDIILQTTGLSVGYTAASPLFKADDIDFRRTECAGLIGPNGSGKTTFLKTILGQLPPLAGNIRLGASLEVGYFAQVHDDLDMESSVLDELLAHHPMLTSEARDYLAKFLFVGDDVFKLVSSLSGGERGRLALAIMMRDKANFLLLDEPTNHLDIPAQEVLERVLSDFDGTLILVSHDRYLISRLATQIWALEDNQLQVFEGGYPEYVAQREKENLEREGKERSRREYRRPARDGQRRQREFAERLASLEQEISELEKRLVALGVALEDAGAGRQLDKVRELGLEYSSAEEELQRRLAEWARLADE